MAVNFVPYDLADDDYIDMEICSYSNFHCHSLSSASDPREFEFQMSLNLLEKEVPTSPADELFYKGKLLPLHLPPRLQMVEKLLENSNHAYDSRNDVFEDLCITPLMTTATTPTTTSTPYESCNASPLESCYVSRELNPEEYLSEYSSDVNGFIGDSGDVNGFIGGNQKKSWTKKLNLIKQSSLGFKLKASRAYLKSFFGKSGCSDGSCTAAVKVADEATVSKAKVSLNNTEKKSPFGHIQRMQDVNKQKISENGNARLHRRSLSMAIKRHSTTKSSSSLSSSGCSSFSSSTNSIRLNGFPFLKRSSSMSSESENPIQGAIAHCKRSQQLSHPRKPVSEVGFYSLSASKSIYEDQERPELCRG